MRGLVEKRLNKLSDYYMAEACFRGFRDFHLINFSNYSPNGDLNMLDSVRRVNSVPYKFRSYKTLGPMSALGEVSRLDGNTDEKFA